MTHPGCTCPEDAWQGARGHINLTMNGHWPLTEDDSYVECHICGGHVRRAYADKTKPAMNGEPLYTTSAAWHKALARGVAYRVTAEQAIDAGRRAKKRAAELAKREEQEKAERLAALFD